MNDCPVCKPGTCKAYPHIWRRMSEDPERWRGVHDRLNGKPVLSLRGQLAKLQKAKLCRFLDKKCGCEWGTCKNRQHERFGKDVGYHDCLSCGLMEVDDGKGEG